MQRLPVVADGNSKGSRVLVLVVRPFYGLKFLKNCQGFSAVTMSCESDLVCGNGLGIWRDDQGSKAFSRHHFRLDTDLGDECFSSLGFFSTKQAAIAPGSA